MRRQYLAYVLVSAVAGICFAVLAPSHRALFVPFLGSLHPWLVAITAIIAGGLAMRLLMTQGFSVVRRREPLRGVAVAGLLSTLFALVIVTADSFYNRYPRDINVHLPEALLFYPGMAFLVEVGLHLLPLALFWVALRPFRSRIGDKRFAWMCIGMTALIEPTFQLALEPQPHAFTWLHVFAFNVAQLMVFRRYDFISILCLRLFYYAYWHILWGVIRLHVLF